MADDDEAEAEHPVYQHPSLRIGEAEQIDEAMNNRNCRPVIKVYDGFDVLHLPNARPIVADRHGRLWAYHEDCSELRMIHDPEAARC